MIITPKCQLFLDFQNNVIDKGHAGLTWTPQGSGASYVDGKIGRAYEHINSTNNWLNAGSHTNPLNLSDEFFCGAWVKKSGVIVRLLDLGWQAAISGGSRSVTGIIVIFTEFACQFVAYHGDDSLYNLGGTFGRHFIDFEADLGKWYFYACYRNNSSVGWYIFDEGGKLVADSYIGSLSLPDYEWPTSRIYRIGRSTSNAADNSIGSSNDFQASYIEILNKSLDFGDIQRTMLGMHPING